MNLEFNKIFAAVLVAGITASGASFFARQVMDSHHEEADAVPIQGVESVASGEAAGPTGPEPILALIAAADVAKGQKLSKACAACHSFEKGGPDRVGPNLWNVVGGPKEHKAGFAYSGALAKVGGTWSYDNLNHFLYKPAQYAPGTKMNYIGLKKPEDRAAIVAWLRTMADSPYGLPSEADIAAEKAALAPPEVADAPAEAAEPADAAKTGAATPPAAH